MEGGNTDVAALPIECRGGACAGPARLRQSFVPHNDITPQPPLVEPMEHLKKRDNCNVE